MERMNDKTALVTGAGSGIGKAAALKFAKSGANVVVAEVAEKDGEETVDQIKKQGGEAIFVKTDVSNPDDVENMIGRTVEAYGRLDYAFNNAGIEGDQAPTGDASLKNWNKVIAINLTGVWLCMKAEIQQMLKNHGGVIVNMSSVAGRVGFTNIPAYTASKHGVLGLTKNAALEYAETGIRVNAVCPGVIHTDMIDRFTGGDKEAIEGMAAMQPMNRMGKPEEVADLVVYLCSDQASFITGESVAIDGGFTAR